MALDTSDFDGLEKPEPASEKSSLSTLKLYAPNGDVRECIGSIGFIPSLNRNPCMDLLLVGENGNVLRRLNRHVVVVDQKDGSVLYDPRLSHLLGFPVLDQEDMTWLRKNPDWPKILELHDNPVLPLEDRDGLYADYEGEES